MRALRRCVLLAVWPALLSCGGRPSEVPAPERPEPPSALRTTPASPSAKRHLVLSGTAPGGSVVRVFASKVCDGYPLALVDAEEFAQGISLDVVPSSTNAFSANAALPGSGESACSEPVLFVQDPAAGPAAPQLSRTVPASPSRERSMRVFGKAAAPGTVRLYLRAGCAGPVSGQGPAAELAASGLPLTVDENSITAVSADVVDSLGRESDCSAAIQYEHDTIPPDPPVLVGTSPASPSSERTPCVLLAPVQGTPRVRLFATPACDGPELSLGPRLGSGCGWEHSPATVPRNSATTLFAHLIDEAGNASACSALGLTYVHDDLLTPTPPALYPSRGTEPLTVFLFGRTQTETSNELFGNSACAGAPLALASHEELYSPGVKLSVTAGVTAWFTAVAITTGGARSACSVPVSYTAPP